MNTYIGYVYIWYDTKSKFFYIGGHKGRVTDTYICSNEKMLRAYKLRPETFRFRVLEYVNGSTKDLRLAEQKWLDMIKDQELYWTPNIKAKTTRYYNQKKQSSGGNGSANKGKPHHWSWNRGKTGVQEYTEETRRKMSIARKEWWRQKKLGEGVCVTENTFKSPD